MALIRTGVPNDNRHQMPCLPGKDTLICEPKNGPDPEIAFTSAMAECGLHPPKPLVTGKIQRFHVRTKGLSGWYWLDRLGDSWFGAYGDWASLPTVKWSSVERDQLTPEETKKFERDLAEAEARRKAEKKRIQEKIKNGAQQMWEKGLPASNHCYLDDKRVISYGLRVNGEVLLVPMRDADGVLWNLQKIFTDGKKRFMAGGRLKGLYFTIQGDDIIVVCEGYATGATIHEATGHTVLVAFNTSNLEAVCKAIRAKKPSATIIVAADNDQWAKRPGGKPWNPGVSYATSAARSINGHVVVPKFASLENRPTDFNDLGNQEGLSVVREQFNRQRTEGGTSLAGGHDSINKADEGNKGRKDQWGTAMDMFPKVPFPWKLAFAEKIFSSLKQLARSCATSAIALPASAISIFASLLGGTVIVSPKRQWKEPMIFWFADIRPSGCGKTHAARMLMGPLYEAQKKADLDYERRFQEWQNKPKAERGQEPKRARGYFCSDLTIEGIRDDISGHGGTVCLLDELSALVNGQNQYKAKGTDREAMLSLYDGKATRTVRVGKSITISSACVNIFGGIQPQVWRMAFGGSNGVYMSDGTVFRLLPVFENGPNALLDDESWSEESQHHWETLLNRAMEWADGVISNEAWKPRALELDPDAYDIFCEWRNKMVLLQNEIPDAVRGFIPKICGASLRLAGVLHCMHRFAENRAPADVLGVEDIVRGIKVAMFYMGHIIHAMKLIVDDKFTSESELSGQALHLAATLEELRPELDSGRLAIGYIWEKHNAGCHTENTVSSPKAMGSLIRSAGLTVTGGKHNANGKRAVSCVVWDGKADAFVEEGLKSLQCLQQQDRRAYAAVDIDHIMSEMSVSGSMKRAGVQTSGNQSPHGEPDVNQGDADKAGKAGFIMAEIFSGGRIPNEVTI